MGKVRRGGYVFQWWIGDHPPRHVHVFDGNFFDRRLVFFNLREEVVHVGKLALEGKGK